MLSKYSGYLLCITLMLWNEQTQKVGFIWIPYVAFKLAETKPFN